MRYLVFLPLLLPLLLSLLSLSLPTGANAQCAGVSVPDPPELASSSFLTEAADELVLTYRTSQLHAAVRFYFVDAEEAFCNNASLWEPFDDLATCDRTYTARLPFPAALEACGFEEVAELRDTGWIGYRARVHATPVVDVGEFETVEVVYERTLVASTLLVRHPESVAPSRGSLQVIESCAREVAAPRLDADLSGLGDSAGATLAVAFARSVHVDSVSYTFNGGSSSCDTGSATGWEIVELDSGCAAADRLVLPTATMLSRCWNAGTGSDTFDEYTTEVCAEVRRPAEPFSGTARPLSAVETTCSTLRLRLPAAGGASGAPDLAVLSEVTAPLFGALQRVLVDSETGTAAVPGIELDLRVRGTELGAGGARAGVVRVVTSVAPAYTLSSPAAVALASPQIGASVASDQAPPPAAVCAPQLSDPGALNCAQAWEVTVTPAEGRGDLNTVVDLYFSVECAEGVAGDACAIPPGSAAPQVKLSLLPFSSSLDEFAAEVGLYSDSARQQQAGSLAQGATVYASAGVVQADHPEVVVQNTFLLRVTTSTNTAGHRQLMGGGVISDTGSECGFVFFNGASRATFSFALTPSCVDLGGATSSRQDVAVTADVEVHYRFAETTASPGGGPAASVLRRAVLRAELRPSAAGDIDLRLRTLSTSPSGVVLLTGVDASGSGGGGEGSSSTESSGVLGLPAALLGAVAAGLLVAVGCLMVLAYQRRKRDKRELSAFEREASASARMQRIQGMSPTLSNAGGGGGGGGGGGVYKYGAGLSAASTTSSNGDPTVQAMAGVLPRRAVAPSSSLHSVELELTSDYGGYGAPSVREDDEFDNSSSEEDSGDDEGAVDPSWSEGNTRVSRHQPQAAAASYRKDRNVARRQAEGPLRGHAAARVTAKALNMGGTGGPASSDREVESLSSLRSPTRQSSASSLVPPPPSGRHRAASPRRKAGGGGARGGAGRSRSPRRSSSPRRKVTKSSAASRSRSRGRHRSRSPRKGGR